MNNKREHVGGMSKLIVAGFVQKISSTCRALRLRREFFEQTLQTKGVTISTSLLLCCYNVSFAQMFDSEMMKQSSVVFVGTIVRLGAATFSEVQISSNTSVVTVDQVLQKPAAISIKEGQEITLELKSSLAVGSQATFYADGWILGKGTALREIGHKISPVASSTAARGDERKKFFDARKEMMDAQFRARIDSADMVALGEVISIQPLTTEARRRITEHDPSWQEAVVKVRKGMKGVADGVEIVVRFPASMDVAFYGIPKLNKGDEQVMMLRADTRVGMQKALIAGKELNAYTIEKASDILGKEQLQQVIEIMKLR